MDRSYFCSFCHALWTCGTLSLASAIREPLANARLWHDVEIGARGLPKVIDTGRFPVELLLPQPRAYLDIIGAAETNPSGSLVAVSSKVPNLLDAGAARFQHPKIGEQSIEIGYTSFPAQKPGNTAPMIFEQHGLMCR